MRWMLLSTLLLTGCAVIPVQEATVRNDQGNSITCKQVGRGMVSYSIGKSVYENCLIQATARGYR